MATGVVKNRLQNYQVRAVSEYSQLRYAWVEWTMNVPAHVSIPSHRVGEAVTGNEYRSRWHKNLTHTSTAGEIGNDDCSV